MFWPQEKVKTKMTTDIYDKIVEFISFAQAVGLAWTVVIGIYMMVLIIIFSYYVYLVNERLKEIRRSIDSLDDTVDGRIDEIQNALL